MLAANTLRADLIAYHETTKATGMVLSAVNVRVLDAAFPHIAPLVASVTRRIPTERGHGRLLRQIARLPAPVVAGRRRTFSGQHGVRWTTDTFPDLMTTYMFWFGTYQEDVLSCMRRFLRKGDTFFDVGAHFGLMAITASRLVGPTGAVVAFEPNPHTAAVLRRHLKLNEVGNAVVEEVGLMDRPGDLDFYTSDDVSWNSTFSRQFAELYRYESTNVPVVTLDDYVGRTGTAPGFMKIDVEGSEYECLTGADRTLKDNRPIIVIEVNPISQERTGHNAHDILGLLSRYGYTFHVPRPSIWGRFNGRHFDTIRAGDDMRTVRSGQLFNALCLPHRPDSVRS
jgi:FkbM family methyltransferase